MTNKSFLSKKIDEHTVIYFYDLNIKIKYSEYILSLSSLIIQEKEKGNIVNIKPDKRLRASGLHVLFSNKPSYYDKINKTRQHQKEIFKQWKIKT